MRLDFFTRSSNSYARHVDLAIKCENLQFNLSHVIAKVILKLHFINREKSTFEKIIDDYNLSSKSSLSFQDFEKIAWIRVIAGDAIMPEVVMGFIRRLERKERDGEVVKVPKGKEDLIKCLQSYYRKCFEESELTISGDELHAALRDTSVEPFGIHFLLERHIVALDPETGNYFWMSQNDYARHLRNEIASTLWLFCAGENATAEEFKRFFKLILGADIWPDDLGGLLTQKNISKIRDRAFSFAGDESDLQKSDIEFSKIWLDADRFIDHQIDSEIPVVEFDYSNTYNFIASVEFHRKRFPDVFDHQASRSYCSLLLRLILSRATNEVISFDYVLEILKDVSRPSLLWMLFRDLRMNFAFAIPYLCANAQLIPIAFKLINQIEIDSTLLSEQSDREKNFDEGCEMKNRLWLEMFGLILEEISSQLPQDELGNVIARIICDLSEKVFDYNTNNQYRVVIHNALKRRYESAIKILKHSVPPIDSAVYSKSGVKPRLVLLVFPTIAEYIANGLSWEKPNYTEFLYMNNGLVHLAAEILRLSRTRVFEHELSAKQERQILESADKLTYALYGYLSKYYTKNEVSVTTYKSPRIEKRGAIRGLNQVGIEIIEWAYLYLCFEDKIILTMLSEAFLASLQFDTTTSKYNSANKEQLEKAKLFLKTAMLALISLNQNQDLYEIDRLPVARTRNLLITWISKLAITYAIDDLPHKRVDIFEESVSVFGPEIYYQTMTALLYRCVNSFPLHLQEEFFSEFFARDSDLHRMLMATNALDAQRLRELISKKINQIKVEDFIRDASTVTELQHALLEAVNSENHWKLARPLFDRIRDHFDRVGKSDAGTQLFLFEVNLLLAFKSKDLEAVKNLPITIPEFSHRDFVEKFRSTREFFIALHQIYNARNYKEGTAILKAMLSKDPKNIRYAYHIYRSETLTAIEST